MRPWIAAPLALAACSSAERWIAELDAEPAAALFAFSREPGHQLQVYEPVPRRIELDPRLEPSDVLVYTQPLERVELWPNGDRLDTSPVIAPEQDTRPFPPPDAWFVRGEGGLVEEPLAGFAEAFAAVRVDRPPCRALKLDALVDLDSYAPVTFSARLGESELVIGLAPYTPTRPNIAAHPAELRRVTRESSTILPLPAPFEQTREPVGATLASGKVRALMFAFGPVAMLEVDEAGQLTQLPAPMLPSRAFHAATSAIVRGVEQLYALDTLGALLAIDPTSGAERVITELARGECSSAPRISADADGRGFAQGRRLWPGSFDAIAGRRDPIAPFEERGPCPAAFAREPGGREAAVVPNDVPGALSTTLYHRAGPREPWRTHELAGVSAYNVAFFRGELVIAASGEGVAIVELEPSPRVCTGVAQGFTPIFLVEVGEHLTAAGTVNDLGLANRVAWLRLE